jgi:hypothetical protein
VVFDYKDRLHGDVSALRRGSVTERLHMRWFNPSHLTANRP